MAIFKDDESKQDILDLIEKFDKSNLFELEITIPVAQYTKIKMMKLSQDKPEGKSVRVKVDDEDVNDNENDDLDIVEENVKPKREKTSVNTGSKTCVITAPLVGTFYSSSSPDSGAYVKVGDKVKKGMIICIIEAMKIMNEIESEADGEIAEILVNNGSPVEYGQPLFRLK